MEPSMNERATQAALDKKRDKYDEARVQVIVVSQQCGATFHSHSDIQNRCPQRMKRPLTSKTLCACWGGSFG